MDFPQVVKIKVIPNSKLNKIVEQKDNFLKIKLTAPACEGKANKALILFLSQEFKIAKNKIRIIKGEKSREKLIQIS
jgi:hypothetical protein